MVIVWLLIQLLFLCLFFALPSVTIKEPVQSGETVPLLKENHVINKPVGAQSPSNNMPLTMRLWCLVREETVVVLAVLFVVMFQQTALEVGGCG